MATINAQIAHDSGIPLGGLGTGSVEIRADGYFHEWQIFNLGQWAPRQPDTCKVEGPDMLPGALSFFVRMKREGEAPRIRRLGLRQDQHDLYSHTWLKSVSGITFDGQFPVARLTYHIDDMPVSICATMFSPFTPHDARTSGTPGCHMVFEVQNQSDEPMEVSLLSTLSNPLAACSEDRKLFNSMTRDGDTTYLTMRTKATAKCKASLGSLGLSVTGGDASWILGDFSGYTRGRIFHVPSFTNTMRSLVRDFVDAGRLPSLSGGKSPPKVLGMTNEEITALSLVDKKALVRKLRRYASVEAIWKYVRSIDPELLKGGKGLALFLQIVRNWLHTNEGADRTKQTWGDCALASTVKLAAFETREIRFTLGWHFPYHYSELGVVLGHMYEHWFDDAEAVNRFLAKNYEKQRDGTCSFADALYDTTLPVEMADAWSGQLTTLSKCTWWTKAGDFAVWEGLGCCGFHTTDITYQGSFNILALFPELQKGQMAMGARFQREDGRVHHFFTPDLSRVDNGFDRVDMNQQFVLLVCRDYLWTGDRKYVRRLWPNICRAMDSIGELDRDGDGLPDHDTRRNTYDAWNFRGTPSYIASLWLSALLAAIRIAEDLGHGKRAAAWRRILKKGRASFEKKLWNGEYYSLWVDGTTRDECCMTDQVDGDWFTHLIGLGSALPRERLVAALRAVMKYNYTDDAGLRNASYPSGKRRRISTYRNMQQDVPWTGIEYAIASMMLDLGLVAEGQKVVKNIHNRYSLAGRFWNHVECGDHYYRAMSSWGILLGATGFKVDVPNSRITFAPALRAAGFRAPWVSSTGWGTFEQTDDRFVLKCKSGNITWRELCLNMNGKMLNVRRNGRNLRATVSHKDPLRILRFANRVVLRSGDRLVVET